MQRGWGANRKAESPVAIHLTSCTPNLRAELEPMGLNGWEVAVYEDKFDKVFQEHDIVYLTPDSPNVLRELSETTVYVIGGVVDRPIRKVSACLYLILPV